MSDSKIVVDGVAKSFVSTNGALPVIDGVSFHVDHGEFVAIVGPSGCGKSTLLNIIAGFERQDQGAVKINGVERVGPSPKGIVISQYGSVFPWLTVQQNLMRHADIRTTMNIYGKAMTDSKRQAHSKVVEMVLNRGKSGETADHKKLVAAIGS